MATAKSASTRATKAPVVPEPESESESESESPVVEKGFIGEAVDDTPREHYTVAGVLAGKPTPETT